MTMCKLHIKQTCKNQENETAAHKRTLRQVRFLHQLHAPFAAAFLGSRRGFMGNSQWEESGVYQIKTKRSIY